MPAKNSLQASSGRAFLALTGLLVITAIAFLAFSVQREIRLLASAQSDNVQWSLAQAEVEFLEYTRQLEITPPELIELKQRFDVFFSRVRTVQAATVFTD